MFRLLSIIVALLVSVSASAAPTALPDCGEVFASEAGKLQAQEWQPVGQPQAPFFILLIKNSYGHSGAIIVAPDPFAGQIYQNAKGSSEVEIKTEKTCQAGGVPHLFLVVVEPPQKA
jgi:hypothetical protein